MGLLKKSVAFTAVLFLSAGMALAQEQGEKALKLLDQAIGDKMQNNKLAMTFEGIAFGVAKPAAIFTMPVYEVVRGGFLYIDGEKYEMALGAVKSLCDGKLSVVIDEASKTMVVDSVRNVSEENSDAPDIEKLMNETFGGSDLSYEGQEKINGKLCHRIKAEFTNQEKTHVLYWIDAATNQLLLMAEHNSGAYDVYWFRSVGLPPAAHDYTVNLPKKHLEKYYGYEVVDMRFTLNEIRAKGVN